MADLRLGHIRVPRALLLYPGLSPTVLKTYIALMSFAYGNKMICWPSCKTLAAVTGFSERTIKRHLSLLDKQGFIDRQEREGHTTVYTINLKRFSPILAVSVAKALLTLHPLLKRKTTNREWQILIKHDRLLAGKVRR